MHVPRRNPAELIMCAQLPSHLAFRLKRVDVLSLCSMNRTALAATYYLFHWPSSPKPWAQYHSSCISHAPSHKFPLRHPPAVEGPRVLRAHVCPCTPSSLFNSFFGVGLGSMNVRYEVPSMLFQMFGLPHQSLLRH